MHHQPALGKTAAEPKGPLGPGSLPSSLALATTTMVYDGDSVQGQIFGHLRRVFHLVQGMHRLAQIEGLTQSSRRSYRRRLQYLNSARVRNNLMDIYDCVNNALDEFQNACLPGQPNCEPERHMHSHVSVAPAPRILHI